MSAFPVRVILAFNVAPFDATLMATKPLLSESRYRLVVFDVVEIAAVFTNLAALATLPERAIFPDPVFRPPFSTTFVRAEPIKPGSRRRY